MNSMISATIPNSITSQVHEVPHQSLWQNLKEGIEKEIIELIMLQSSSALLQFRRGRRRTGARVKKSKARAQFSKNKYA